MEDCEAMTTPSPTPTNAPILNVGDVTRQLIRKPPVLLVILLEILPTLYLVVYGRGTAAGVVTMATLALMGITLLGGAKVGLLNVPIFSGLMVLTCVAPGRPYVAGGLALIDALWASFGAASGKGALIALPASMTTVLILVPPQVANTATTQAWHNVIAVLAYGVLSAFWGVALGLMARRGRKIPVIPGAPWKWGLTQGLLVGIVMAGAAGIATSRNLGQGGAWLVMTIFLVFKPLTPSPWVKSVNRVFGTVIGVVLVAVYLKTLPPSASAAALLVPAALMLIASAFILLAQRWPYWCFVALFTPAIVLFLACFGATSTAVSMARHLDALRIEYSLLGIAVALGAEALLIGLTKIFHLENSRLFGHPAQRDPGGA